MFELCFLPSSSLLSYSAIVEPLYNRHLIIKSVPYTEVSLVFTLPHKRGFFHLMYNICVLVLLEKVFYEILHQYSSFSSLSLSVTL